MDKITEYIKNHYDSSNTSSVGEMYEKTGVAEIVLKFINAVALEHIIQYAKKDFRELSDEEEGKFLENIQEIIDTNMKMGALTTIVDEVENIVSWIETDVYDFIGELDIIPDYNISQPQVSDYISRPQVPDDDLDDVWNTEPEEPKEKSTPIKWDKNDW